MLSLSVRNTLFIGVFSAFTLTACGGGGGGGGTTSGGGGGIVSGGGNGGSGTDITWTAGEFKTPSTFAAQCENPRSGSDPVTGEVYPDRAGSTTIENHWIRSHTNDTYLWYEEIPDLNPANYTSTAEYFSLNKTTATTASGKLKDQFSGSRDTADYNQAAFAGESAGYGMDVSGFFDSTRTFLTLFVRYVDAGSPAAIAGIRRGDTFTQINGQSTQFGLTAAQSHALFPSAAGSSNSFTFERGSETVTFQLESQVLEDAPVHLATTFTDGEDTVGYMMLNTFGSFSAEEAARIAMQGFAQDSIDDLVLDLRYNGGGFLFISSQLGYMIAGDAATRGKAFNTPKYNSKHTVVDPFDGQPITDTPFYNATFNNSPNVSLPALNLDRVFILTDGGTCSASESLINSLRGVDIEVILIGDTTCGKPYGFVGQDNCGTTYFPVQIQSTNDKGFGDYADGFTPSEIALSTDLSVPGCGAQDDLSFGLGDVTEPKLAAALQYRNTGTCPAAPTAVAKSALSQGDIVPFTRPDTARNFIRNNQIGGLPTRSEAHR